MRGLPAIPRLRTAARIPRGPELYRQPAQKVGGPGEPPPGFVGHRNSAVEWPPYWGLAKIFANPTDPRTGPFNGGWPDWEYQNPDQTGAGVTGSVIDFVVYKARNRSTPLAIRVQTERFHLYVDAYKQGYDAMQRSELERYFEVVDIFDYQYMGDPTGKNVIVLLKQVLGLIEIPNPLVAGTAQRVTR